MLLQLLVEHQEHQGRHRRQCKGPVRENRKRCVRLAPGIHFLNLRRMAIHHPRHKSHQLKNRDHGCGKEPEQGDPVGWPHHKVEEDQRPGQEGQDFAVVSQWALAPQFAPCPKHPELADKGQKHTDNRPPFPRSCPNSLHPQCPA